jgi:hypothetical protein
MTTDSVSHAAAWPPAVPPLPRLWVGFLLAFCFFAGVSYAGLAENEELLLFFRVMISIAAWAEWLYCVHRYHTVLRHIAPRLPNGSSSYPISPGEAVGYHFIPFYNLYWLFRWPSAISELLTRSGIQMTSGTLVGALLLCSFVAVRLDGAIGFALLFACFLSIAGPIRKAVLQYARDERALQALS